MKGLLLVSLAALCFSSFAKTRTKSKAILKCESVVYGKTVKIARFDVTPPNSKLTQESLIEDDGVKIVISSFEQSVGLYVYENENEVVSTSTYLPGNYSGAGGVGKLSIFTRLNGNLIFSVCDYE